MRVGQKLVGSSGAPGANKPVPAAGSADSSTSEANRRVTPPARPVGRGAAPVESTNAAAVVVAVSAVAPNPPSNPMAARIERVRELIHAGEYRIDLDALASRIADDDILRSTKP